MPHGCLILANAPEALVEICGIPVLERLLRTLQRCGVRRATILSRTPDAMRPLVANPDAARRGLRVDLSEEANAILDPGPLFLVVRGDTIYDPRLIDLLLAQEKAMALSNDAAALAPRESAEDFAGLTKIDIDALPHYSPALRRNLRPYCFSIAKTSPAEIERALIDATQKGARDFPAFLHAPIEKALVARFCKTRVTPHQITIAWIILALITTGLFAFGQIGCGIALALIVGILDGLDGKLARLRVETSAAGKLEHHFDSFFEVAWPGVLALHFFRTGELSNAFAWLALLILAQIADGLAKGAIYGAFAKLMRAPDLLDRVVRFFGGRRNVFIWILLIATIAGAPAKGLIGMSLVQLATAIVDLPHAFWLRSRTR